MAKPDADREINPINQYVGGRIRLRRTLLGVTQQTLADQLGVTWQQLQKYEGGVNRVSADRLWQISQILNVPPGWFYEGIPVGRGVDPKDLPPDTTMLTADSLDLLRHYNLLTTAQQAALRRFVSTIVEPDA